MGSTGPTGFSAFFNASPTGVLTTAIMNSPVPYEQFDTAGGHAVVVDISHCNKGSIAIKNSWGNEWADHGIFHIARLDVLNGTKAWKVYDVTWTLTDLRAKLKQRYEKAMKGQQGNALKRLESDLIFTQNAHSTLCKNKPVYRGKYENELVAVKVMTGGRDHLFTVDHPNIVKVIGWKPMLAQVDAELTWNEKPSTDTSVVIVLELAEGDLTKFYNPAKGHNLPNDERLRVVRSTLHQQ